MESSDPVRDTDAETMRLGCCSIVMVVGCFAPLRVSIVRGNSADCAALFELSEGDVPSESLDCWEHAALKISIAPATIAAIFFNSGISALHSHLLTCEI